MNQKIILVLFAMLIGMTMLLGVVGAMCEEEKTVDKNWEREKICLQSGGRWDTATFNPNGRCYR